MSRTEKRNVVLIHLESTRAQSVTPYNEELQTTPFLDELARESLLAERAYAVVPRSSKGSVAVNCGMFWPKDGLRIRPGRAVIEFLDPLTDGQSAAELVAEVEARVEAASDRLMADAGLRLPPR